MTLLHTILHSGLSDIGRSGLRIARSRLRIARSRLRVSGSRLRTVSYTHLTLPTT